MPTTTTDTSTQPACRVATSPARPTRVAAIGLGERAAWMLKCMAEACDDLRIDAIIDPHRDSAMKRIADSKLPLARTPAFFDSVGVFLADGAEVDALVLGTRCHLHTPLAVQLAATGLPLFLEKPVAISWEQLSSLREAFESQSPSRVVVSFPLRRTPLFEAVHAIVRSGRLGTINQVQAVNNVSYGAVYVDNWYRHYDLAGGLWLQKATHDFDYIHHLAGGTPTHVSAMHSRQVWQEPVLNQDAGSALIQYHHGVHACYSQNFLTRRSAGRRGATLTGELGTVWFDWPEKKIRVTSHEQERVEDITIDQEAGHGGGDQRLAQNFIDVIHNTAPSLTPLADGLLSAATCLAARDAAHHRTVQPIPPQADTPPLTPIDRTIEPPR